MDEPENLMEAGPRVRDDDVQEMIGGGGAGLDILGGRPNFEHQQQPSLREVNSLFSLRHYLRESTHEACGRPQGGMEVDQQANCATNRHDLGGAPQILPDFVQDHLHQDQIPYHNIGSHEPPIDLGVGHGNAGSASNNERVGPISSATSSPLNSAPEANCSMPGSVEVGSSKSLPDFLSDGPIRSTRDTPQPSLSLQLENERLQGENERLRLQLSALEQRLRQQCLDNERGQTETNHVREGETSHPRNELGTIENLEADLSLMTARALVAEDAVSRLKNEMEGLKAQLRHRQGTNRTAGPTRSDMPSTSAQQTQSERLASQLRNAAYNAEMSLRQLLSGVDNLRHLADSLDPLSPVVSRPSSASSMDDDVDDLYNSSLPGRSRKPQ